MGRFARGLKLLGESWSVLWSTPSLIGVMVLGVLGHAVISGLAVLAAWQAVGTLDGWPNSILLLACIGLGSYASQFAAASVMATAYARMSGQPATAADGVRMAAARLPRLLLFNTLTLTVGLVLAAVAERLRVGGLIARWLLGLAWALATYFVVPVLVVEDVPVGKAIQRSAGMIKRTWGEAVVANSGIGIVWAVVMIPFFVVIGGLAVVSPIAAAVTTVLAVSLLSAVALATEGVLRASLYAYAAEGRVAGPFDADDLASRFRPKR